MSETKETDECPSEEAASQDESFDANKSGTSETYDLKDFCPGIRIEAKDFDGKWYPAKVSDVDWTENEILVHFENWNSKFDEWIPMDSSRLRPIQKPLSIPQKEVIKFSKGEEVMAVWSANQKYPGVIQAVLPNDRYDVLFSDGFLKRLKSHKISKMQGGTVRNEVTSFTDIGTKEERRERKRKINVAELFHVNKRPRKKGLVHSKSQDIKTYPVTKSRNKSSVVKKAEEGKEEASSTEKSEVKPSEEKVLVPGVPAPSKSIIDNMPASFEVKYLNGQTEMWSKQLYQRSEGRTAGKLDIVILNPQGRKFRSRNEIMKYCEENGIVYSHEAFDFSAKGRPKSKSVLQTPPVKVDPAVDDKDKFSFKKNSRKSQVEMPLPLAVGASPVDVLPPESLVPNKVFIGEYEVVIENGKFICPVKVCGKHFRRENLLHMHMKHYHPEFSKYLDYTPSVTDLAYARTVGSLDTVEVPSPAPRKIIPGEKVEKTTVKNESIKKVDTPIDAVKESKKSKSGETRSHLVKEPSEITIPVPPGDELVEESQRTKFNSSSFQVGKSLTEVETPTHENKGIALNDGLPEKSTPDTDNVVSSSFLMKSSRHHRLNSRKKTSRFQSSFADRIRKKRFITQDRSRPHNRINRQQQAQQIRQQLQEPQPSVATISSHSVTEETNSNTLSQSYSLARYPKPHLNISNEISGKNNLLTSCKDLSPVSDKENSENTETNSDITRIEGHGKTFEETEKSNSFLKKKKSASVHDRRSFLAGLIKARNRKRRRLKKKRNLEKLVENGRITDTESGQNQSSEKPDDKNAELSCDDSTKPDERSLFSDPEETLGSNQNLPEGRKSVKLRIKQISIDNKTSYDSFLEDDIKSEVPSSTEPVIVTSEPSLNLMDSNNSSVSINDNLGSTENVQNSPQSLEPKQTKDYSYLKLPKSYVLLENIFRKESYLKQMNVSLKENVVGKELDFRGRSDNKKRKRARRFNQGRDRRQMSRKRVRFENTVMEKWINVDDEEDYRCNEINAKRKEEKKKKERVEYINEKDLNQRSDESSRDQKFLQKISAGDQAECTEDSKSPLAVDNDKVEKLRRNEIINCLCGITEEDGLMIQCDLCLCWQHGHCAGILREQDVPDKYTCAICKNPYRARSSMKYLHDQEWLKEGTLPSLSFRSKRDDLINQRKTILKRSHDLSGSITLLAQVIHSLRIKVNIAEKKDHPKLWLWAKKWTEKKQNRLKEETEVKEEKTEDPNYSATNEVKLEEGGTQDEKQIPKAPEPEAPIDSAECRLNLLDHLIHYQTLVDARLSCIENLVAELESMQDDAVNDETPDRYPRTKATVQMILRDLNTMKKIASI